ncbi:hypothetical protein COO60DRAFT_1556230 [Scenedesmus sp. NREL 46B-D3]|nr:hypothetical protein COO60DRAFT_1556230 [Scenedesmus sp. NREL 46B-D3]
MAVWRRAAAAGAVVAGAVAVAAAGALPQAAVGVIPKTAAYPSGVVARMPILAPTPVAAAASVTGRVILLTPAHMHATAALPLRDCSPGEPLHGQAAGCAFAVAASEQPAVLVVRALGSLPQAAPASAVPPSLHAVTPVESFAKRVGCSSSLSLLEHKAGSCKAG